MSRITSKTTVIISRKSPLETSNRVKNFSMQESQLEFYPHGLLMIDQAFGITLSCPSLSGIQFNNSIQFTACMPPPSALAEHPPNAVERLVN